MLIDLKPNIIKYITGNITPKEKKQNYFRSLYETNSSIEQALAEKGISVNHYSILTTTTTSNYLVYGGYLVDGNTRGFIAVLDQKGNVLELITKYDSGSYLQWIWYLDYDENGTIYGIDEAPNSPYNLRIILLNNVALETSKGYFCKLRASYYISQSNYDIPASQRFSISWQDYSMPHIIRKVPGEATYFIFGSYGGNYSCLIKFVNNVGMPNEWEVYQGHELDAQADIINRCDMQVEKENDTYKAYLYYIDTNATTLKYEFFNGTALTNYTEYSIGKPIMSIRIADRDTMYFTTRYNNQDGTYLMNLNEIDKESLTTITSFTFEASIPSFNLCVENGILYGIAKGNTTINSTAQYNYVCVAYKEGEYVVSPVYSFVPNPTTIINFNTAVQSSFALHKFIVLSNDKVYHPSVVIYDSMYSGDPYENYGIASIQKGELYSNQNIVFARGLYNKQIYKNQTTSTIEIPNGYLNDSPITEEIILSKDNNLLITENETINKNIYENLFLNFTYYLSVIDDDTDTTYPEIANYINRNINVGNEENFNTTKITKLRVNYQDYSVMQNITWEKVDNIHYQMSVVIDTTQIPLSIDFMSNDETTIYLTKELNLDQGKFYILTQKIRIE